MSNFLSGGEAKASVQLGKISAYEPPKLSDRERFLTLIGNQSVEKGDAIVLLSGDGEARIRPCVELFKLGAAPGIVIAGGLENPPHSLPTSQLASLVMGLEVAPDRIMQCDRCMHTRDQAERVLALAAEKGWTRLLLVASPYHTPRAFLTFLKVLTERGEQESVRLFPVPTANAIRWHEAPAALSSTRFALLDEEAEKIDRYGKQGHVASYADGIAYLERWEAQ